MTTPNTSLKRPHMDTDTYRNPTVEEDEDDDDLDDLDDVLASFGNSQAQPSSSTASASQPIIPSPNLADLGAPSRSNSALPGKGGDDGGEDEDFEASLMEGMESLLRQLAGDHPPGPMADQTQAQNIQLPNLLSQPSIQRQAQAKSGSNGTAQTGEAAYDEEEAWKKAVEMVLSGEGLAALGLDERGEGSDQGGAKAPATSAPRSSSRSAEGTNARASSSNPGQGNTSYEETLRKTFESINTAGSKPIPRSGPGSGPGGQQPDLASLLASLGGDPDLLKNLNLGDMNLGGDGDEDDGDFADVLEGMMGQLMTKEVLEEPMAELAAKYPPYLASPPAGTSPADLQKYKNQATIVNKIMEIFHRSDYSDDKNGKEIASLVSDMQDLGCPPKEIMGDLPEGFDLSGLGGEDGCTIM